MLHVQVHRLLQADEQPLQDEEIQEPQPALQKVHLGLEYNSNGIATTLLAFD